MSFSRLSLSLIVRCNTDYESDLQHIHRYQLLISLTGHGDTIWNVQYSPDCQVLASASSDGTVRLWEVDTGFPISEFNYFYLF